MKSLKTTQWMSYSLVNGEIKNEMVAFKPVISMV